MKILNLYAGIGGNRKMWGDEHEVTAVEYDEKIASVYSDLYPDDIVVTDDAHDYLLKVMEGGENCGYDFIWSSPPCQSHSSFRQNIGVRYRGVAPVYPDMKLYQEILLLQANAPMPWLVENVKPYYSALIDPTFKLQRHLFWSSETPDISDADLPKTTPIRNAQIPQLQLHHGIDLSPYNISNKRQILRNCVSPALGKHVMESVVQRYTDRLWLEAYA
jgi:DNA (cytosine-5)-methyltransferase 1